MGISLCAYGAAEEVTGSKHLLSFPGGRVLLDCGMFQGSRKKSWEKNEKLGFEANSIDSVLLSHAHFDHSGAIPILTKNGFTGNVFCTPATREISSLIMMDSAHLQAQDVEFLNKKQERNGAGGNSAPLTPHYDESEVLSSLDHFVTVSYHREFWAGDGVKAEFYDAGHILGSALVRLELRDGDRTVSVGYTGDLGREGMAIIRDPEVLPPIDYLVLESTYGNRVHEEMDQALEELSEVVNRAWNRGGKVIIPAFSVGRTQELVYHLHLLYDRKRIPDIPVYVDSPMAVNATSIFRTHPECYDKETRQAFLEHHRNPFGFETLRFITSTDQSKSLNKSDEPMIIISSSGMCEGGRILHHLIHNITDPNNVILIVGFMAQHTLGRRIADRESEIKIFGDKYPVRARVKIINAFSAHADYNEIRDWTGKLSQKDLKGVFLVHGEPEAQEHLAGVLKEDGIRRVEVLEFGKEVEL
ncbi:MAG: MBL fold metallo-hydrolase [bacterium]